MAVVPVIINKSPADDDTGVGAETPITFGIRDPDTRVDVSSVYSAIIYAKSIYDPASEELPTLTEGLDTYFGMFDDVSLANTVNDPADLSIEDISGTKVFRIDQPGDASPHEGILYVAHTAKLKCPVGATVAVNPLVTSIGTYDYVPFVDFTGIFLGLIYWPKNTGIFLFFRDNGSKYLTVAGPAEGIDGSRPAVQTSVMFDWSAAVYTYTFFWDETDGQRNVLVLVTDPATGIETVLANISTADIPEFRDGVYLGGVFSDSQEGTVVLVVGNDGQGASDTLDVYSLYVAGYGKSLIQYGIATGSTEFSIASSDSYLLIDSLAQWKTVGDGTISLVDGISITRTEDISSVAFLSKSEPELEKRQWVVIATISGRDSVHPGSYNTGMGFDVEDGTDRFSVRFLDDFDVVTVGLHKGVGSLDDTANFFLPSVAVDWVEPSTIILVGHGANDKVRMFVDDDEVYVVQTDYDGLATAESGVIVGFIEDNITFTGTFEIDSFWLLTACVTYEPTIASLPAAQGWTVASSFSASLVGNRLRIPGDVNFGGHYVVYITDTDYNEEAGVTVYFRTTIYGWTNNANTPEPAIAPIGPVAAVVLETNAIQVYFIKALSGETYVCLPSADEDFDWVLRQTSDGQRISAQIDLLAAHTFILEVKPRQHIRLYLDYSPVPIIEVSWQERGLVRKALPTNLPDEDGGVPVVAAFGSLDEDHPVGVDFSFVRVSVGKGYDFSTRIVFADNELEELVYGTVADVLIDFRDEDV